MVEQLLARGQPLDHRAKGQVEPKREDLTRRSSQVGQAAAGATEP